MPVGRWGWGWTRARYAAAGAAGKGAIAVLALFGALLYVATAVWFDVTFWLVGRFAADRFDGRVRAGISVAVAVVIVAAIAASGGRTATGPGASPSDLSAIIGSVADPIPPSAVSVTPTSAPTDAPTPAADTPSPSPATADGDDEAGDGASPAASITPGPTGVALGLPGSGSVADRLPGEPDPLLTPGALNPAVTQATIGSTICVSGWTATIRPSSSYTGRLKIEQIAAYGYADTSTSAYEEDHLISLELGGAPTDPRNLWPEPYTASLADGRSTGAHTKDGFETRLKNQVCAGTITLAQAQADIGVHWVHAFYGLPIAAAEPTPTQEATTAPMPPPPPPPVAPPTDDPHAAAKAAGATAICADGTLSYSKTRSGTCSGHGGVHWWTGNVGAAGPGAH